MARLTPEEISEATGEPLAEREAPKSRVEGATQSVDDLDQRMSRLADRHARPGETSAGALSRLLGDNPALYAAHKAAKAKHLTKAGIGSAAVGGV